MSFNVPPAFAALVRYFTNHPSLSMLPNGGGIAGRSVIHYPRPENAQLCTVAAGCFWGTEHMFRKQFQKRGVIHDAKVGYIGGDLEDPSYRAVCGGKTGHAEACQIVFDPKKVSYRELIEFFYIMHDPTTLNQQGPDRGPQYRSAIFFHNEEQEKEAREITALANDQWWGGKIVTEIIPAGQWWDAEDYHQQYLDQNPSGYACPSHIMRKHPPLVYPKTE